MTRKYLLTIRVGNSRRLICWTATILFLFEWVFFAFNVYNREDWFLENILVFVLIGPMIFLYLKGYISSLSYFLLLLFLSLHTVGAHYTYSLVPYEQWGQEILSISINGLLHWQRNNFDRLMHFLWGFLLFRPICEWIRSVTLVSGISLAVFSLSVIGAASTLYEIVEWLAALTFGGNLGIMYVGAQGDVWDAQKDQALAMSGALISWVIFNNKLVIRNQ